VSAPMKLAGFAAALALVFAGAALAGGAVGPERDGDDAAADADAMGGGHGREPAAGGEGGHGGEDAADPVRGLAVSDGGLRLGLDRAELVPGRRTELAFRILGADGRPVRDFEVEHEKRMHLIVVRRDGRCFQHLHPRLGDDGAWRIPIELTEPGSYRVFADFKHDGAARTLAADLAVDGPADLRPLPAPATTADAGDGYEVRLQPGAPRAGREAELSFAITRNGRPVRPAPYLGAAGHLVALREGDLAYLHVHPSEDRLDFTTEFPSEGRYRLYLQFEHEGRVRTAEFTQEVSR
jgi:hypothetical protein